MQAGNCHAVENLTKSICRGKVRSMRVGKAMPAVLFGAILLFSLSRVSTQTAATRQQSENPTEWSSYGGVPDGIRYSSLTQINRSNVSQLQVAWTFDCGEGPGGSQTQPLVAGGVLFVGAPNPNQVPPGAPPGDAHSRVEAGVLPGGPAGGIASRDAGGE